jgi:hypothetical protein
MDRDAMAEVPPKAVSIYQKIHGVIARVPVKARLVLGLFLAAAVLVAVYSLLTAKNSSLRLKLQHGFRSAQISVWVDGDLAYSGRVFGSTRKRFGLIPTESVQGSLSEIIPLSSGRHNIRVRVEPEGAVAQEDAVNGSFLPNGERDLTVSARQSGFSLSWSGTGSSPVETSTSSGWFSRYAGSLFLTIAGSIISALTGFAIRELPGRFRPTGDSAAKLQ